MDQELDLCDARLEGFADCEVLVAAMLERMAAQERESSRPVRASALAEAALAVRLGQHRSAE